jgi:hypothetical protein
MLLDDNTLRTSAVRPIESDAVHLDWTLALAGGEGVRLQDYVQRRFGRRIPKQYCCLLGNRSMLEHTLDRMNRLTPPSRTLTVIGTNHGEIAAPQLLGRSDHVFRQPASRDTGLALYVAIAVIKRWTPNAIVTITPTDHYVAPAAKYVEQLRAARGVAARMRDRVVILGATPNEPDPELGYLSLGEELTEIPNVRNVLGFVEKPSVPLATELSGQAKCGLRRAISSSYSPGAHSRTAASSTCPATAAGVRPTPRRGSVAGGAGCAEACTTSAGGCRSLLTARRDWMTFARDEGQEPRSGCVVVVCRRRVRPRWPPRWELPGHLLGAWLPGV